MKEIQDSGKVWCKGSNRPVHAVRVGNKIFATGKGEDQTIECWVDGDVLCVDLHEREIRIARKIPLDLEPTLQGTLCSRILWNSYYSFRRSLQDGSIQ